jgi:hypothetical protein
MALRGRRQRLAINGLAAPSYKTSTFQCTLSVRPRQGDQKRGAVSRLTLHVDSPTVVRYNDAPAFREPQPQPSPRLAGGLIGVEQVSAFLGCDAGAIVADANPHFRCSLLQVDLDIALPTDRLYRVLAHGAKGNR